MRFLSFTILLGMAACGDDGGSGAPDAVLSGPPCEQLAQRMCNAARACTATSADPTECHWSYGQDNMSGLGRNCAVCEGGLIERFCEDPTKTADMIAACAAALDPTACEMTDERAVTLPDACDDVIVCNAGPCTE